MFIFVLIKKMVKLNEIHDLFAMVKQVLTTMAFDKLAYNVLFRTYVPRN